MNRNYKVIWNRSLGCFTAVAEYAKSRGKSSKSSVSSNATINTTSNLSSTLIFRTTTIWLGLITAGFSMQAIAAPCTGAISVVCGTNATASLLHGVAIGKNATAQGSQAIAIGGGSNGQSTTASGEQSIAIGANVVSSGNSSIAIGGDDLDAASENGVNDIFKGYTGKNLIEDPASPYDGYTQSNGAASVAIGVKARSEGALSTAVGVRSSSTGDASSAFGMGSSASKNGSVALGAGSTTLTNATKETTMSVGGKSYKVAGQAANAGAQVSVGSAGKERQIKHVAAGAVNKDSTDAVNGSQLHATNQSINDLSSFLSDIGNSTSVLAEQMDAGLNFGADTGATINKKLGDSALNFKGGNNITTTAVGSSIEFDLNGEISLDKVITGNTSMSSNGVTIAGGPSMTLDNGINAGGQVITNVADGMAPRDAVNFSQLDAVSRNLGNSINELGYRIDEVEDDANAGISAAMAMSSLPQAYIIGKSMIGGGIATYNGESAVAIGFSKLSDDGRWVMKLNGTADTQGNVGAAIGAGFHFN